MDIDNFRKAAQEVKAPQIAYGGAAGASNATDDLLQAIKAVDETECRQSRKALPLFLLAAAIFAAGGMVLYLGYASGPPSRAIHYGVLAAIFMVVSILIVKKLHLVRALDYSKSVMDVLTETEDRYRFLRPWDFAYMIPLLLILAITGGFALVDALIPRYLLESRRAAVLVVFGLFFIGVCWMGFYFSYKNWKRDKGGIFEDIRRMRRELGSE